MDKKSIQDYLKYVPGFRSDTKWKKIVASIYYILYLFILISDLFIGLVALSMPFIIFYGIDWFKNRKSEGYKSINTKILLAAVVVGFGSAGLADTSSNKVIAKDPIPIEQEVNEEDPISDEDIEIVMDDNKDEVEEVVSKVYKGQRDLKVHFIDVGQGDSIFVELPNGQNALIDGGPRVNAHHLIKYLKTLNFDVIDYLVATHPHEDHIGGLPDVIRNWQIGKVYMPDKMHTTKIFEELITTIQTKGYEIVKTDTDTVLLNEQGLSLKALAPDINTSSSNLNDYSIVLRLDYNNNSFMFTGDAESQTEQYLLADNTDEELKVDVLKVGHHGSKTSSIPQFISKVNPSDAVITCQKDNSYGHPNQETLTTLQNNDITIRRTDTEGTIVAISNGEIITWDNKGNPIKANAPPKKQSSSNQSTSDNESETSNNGGENNANTGNNSGGNGGGGGNTSTQSTQTGQGEVYITPNGKKYHRGACGRGNYSATSLDDALSRGLEPCKKCY